MSFSPPQNPFSVYFLHELREMHAAFGNLPSGRPSKLPMPAEMGAPVFLSLFFALPSSKLLFFHIRKKRAVNICQTQPPQNVTGRMTHHFIFVCWRSRKRGRFSPQSCIQGQGGEKKRKTIDFLTQNSVSSLTAFHRRKRQAKETATWATQIPSRCCRRAW